MCELKKLGARGGSLLCWSTYVTLINTQQSIMHVWGNKKTERKREVPTVQPTMPTTSYRYYLKCISCFLFKIHFSRHLFLQDGGGLGISDEVPGWREGCKVMAPEGPAAMGAVGQTRSETGLTPESRSYAGR